MVSTTRYIPKSITAGLTFQVTVSADDYPAPEWDLLLYLRGPQAIDLTATENGSSHDFNADSATTAAWKVGKYWYSLRATNGAEVVELENAEFEVLADLAQATAPYDGSTDNEKALAAIEAVLSKRATLDQERYKINNRELWRTPVADLLKLRAFYIAQVRKERGISVWGRRINVRFSS